MWKFNVDPSDEQLRLDQLVSVRTGLSRRQARVVLQLGGVQVDRRRVRVAGRILAAGSEVRVVHDDSLGAPPDFQVPVLFEDDWLLVLDKPAGIPCQGTQASDRHDLTALLQRQRPGQLLALQHRLDQGTSGVIVFAKQASAHLGSQFQARTVAKTYLARVSRPLPAAEPPGGMLTVDLPIGRVRGSHPARYGCSGDLADPRPSRTDFRPAAPEETAGLAPGIWVVAEPRTGRTHQIRVHLAHLGCPVLGDAYYQGGPSGQFWLHAWKLVLEHPVTGATLSLTAPPARFLAATEGR
jgi:23S rRNA pseudouridine1911/1915/1917 synthase